MGTALVYHEDMTAARLLWDDPECEIECPERLTTALERLQQHGLEQRCLRLIAREASEAELGLVHSPEYVALLRGTQALGTRELQALSKQYDAVYLHPSTFHCARLAAGATLQLVDAVLTGAVRNGLALVRPPGHHSQRAAANGFCVFNNVAIAAKHAQQKHGLHRILIVDWDVHHGQGIQYIFEDDPSVLYFSWHRYEHGHFWPCLRESDADAVGRGQGLGFTVNLPWNQGGYHLESLSQSVCMMVRALLGDPALPLSGPMEPHSSALESLQCVRAAQAPHWVSLQQQGAAPVLSSGTRCPEGRPSPLPPGEPEFKAVVTQAAAALSSLLDQLRLHPIPAVRVAVTLTAPVTGLALPPGVLCEEGSLAQEEMQAWARPHEALAQDEALIALGKVLYLLDRILDGQVSSGLAATPVSAAAATLDVAVRYGLSHGAQRLLCVAVGKLDRPPDLTDDGYDSRVICTSSFTSGRNLWLSIGGEEATAPSMFHVSVPLPVTTGGFLSCVLALVLPLAYSFQPHLVLVALGPAHGLRDPQAALLAALLRGPAGGRVFALVDEESTPQLATVLARVLNGEAPPSLGPFSMAAPEDTQALLYLRGRLEPTWKMLQAAAPPCVL
ncbi:polyamine deacetylase HDAC10 isoform X6 [Oryx dammah]|uniref:polyamine deacetylase HDAC10 isoform X6 n=1 Tax=Oryx dammah TaxID=59534 RepID=UPI001A9A99D5|nr:polyamine deacetylase HDAC10 isoform X6 [Oryx dammah]